VARKPRIHFRGAFYHVISRGNHSEKIFHDDSDHQRYLSLLEEVRNRYHCKLYAYVLMGNHVHLLVEAEVAPLSKIMQNLQFRYTRYYNLRYGKIGHLFQGRYKAILCDRDNYLLELVRYIHLNPVRAGLSKQVDGYRWSSHSNYLSGDDKGGVSVSAVLEPFGKRRGEAIRQYRQFITEGLGDGHREEYYKVIDQRFLGDEEFVEEVRGKLEEPEMRYPVDIELRDIAKLVCDGFGIRTERVYLREKSREVSQLRWIIGKLACEEGGYRLVEVAGFFGREAGVMSRRLRLLQERLAQGKDLQNRVAGLRLAIQSGRKKRISISHT
jgi:REP element-mobilizing transposase RayT